MCQQTIDGQELLLDLSKYAREEMLEILDRIAAHEYNYGGWRNLNGGYAHCQVDEVDEDEVHFTLVSGEQDCGSGGSVEYRDRGHISRKVLSNHKLSIEEKLREVT